MEQRNLVLDTCQEVLEEYMWTGTSQWRTTFTDLNWYICRKRGSVDFHLIEAQFEDRQNLLESTSSFMRSLMTPQGQCFFYHWTAEDWGVSSTNLVPWQAALRLEQSIVIHTLTLSVRETSLDSTVQQDAYMRKDSIWKKKFDWKTSFNCSLTISSAPSLNPAFQDPL